MIVLDTNVISEMMKPQPDSQVGIWLSRQSDQALVTTAVTIAEIEYGLQRLPEGRRKFEIQASFQAYMDRLSVLPLDDAAAYRAGQFRAIREAAGHASTISDMMIAGYCQHNWRGAGYAQHKRFYKFAD